MKKINTILVTDRNKLREIQRADTKLYSYITSFVNLICENDRGYYSRSNLHSYSYGHPRNNLSTFFSQHNKEEELEDKKPNNIILFKTDMDFPENKIELLLHIKSNSFYRDQENAAKWSECFESKTNEDLHYIRYEAFNHIWTEEIESTNTWHATNIGSLMMENINPIDLSKEEYSEFANKIWSNTEINFLTKEQIAAIINTEDQSKYKMYDLSNLYRGSTDTKYDLIPKSKAAFAKGYKIALAKVKKIAFINGTNTPLYKYVWITNIPQNNFKKYRKCKNFFKFFEKKSQIYSGSFFFDLNLYEEEMGKRFGKNNVYTNFIEKIFGESEINYNTVKMHNQVSETTFDPKSLSIFGQIKKAQKDNKYTSYQKTKQKLEEFTSKINRLNSSKDTVQRRKERINRNLDRLQKEIEDHKRSLTEVLKEEKEVEVNLPGYIRAQTKLSEKIESQKEEYNSYIRSITLQNLEEDAYSQNFEKKGIVIDKVIYLNTTNETQIELTENLQVVLDSLKADANLHLSEITFRITKPVTIYVDRAEKGEDCKKVIGGPYLVKVTPGSLHIGILSSASIVGYNPANSQVWVHPHTSSLHLNSSDVNSFFRSLLEGDLRSACLGEASPAIYSAFQAKDIRQIIIAAMSWITNANSSDAWGKNYKYFPKPEEVISKEFKITKQFINLQTMEEKLMSKDSVFDLFSDSLVQEVERIENEETEQPNENQEQLNQQIQNEPEMVFQLRRPGVPNYQPYTTEN